MIECVMLDEKYSIDCGMRSSKTWKSSDCRLRTRRPRRVVTLTDRLELDIWSVNKKAGSLAWAAAVIAASLRRGGGATILLSERSGHEDRGGQEHRRQRGRNPTGALHVHRSPLPV